MAQHSDHPQRLDSEFEQAIDISLLAVPDLSDEETIAFARQVDASFAGRLREHYEPLIQDSTFSPSVRFCSVLLLKKLTT
jgi:hypothetical protein